MNFFKQVLASIVGFWLAILVVVLIGLGIVASFSVNKIETVKDNSVLEIDLSVSIKDYVPFEASPIKQLFSLEDQIGFNQLMETIRRAQFDDKIKGISLKKIPHNIGWAQASELRKNLENFKSSGKKIWAHSDFYTQKNYYIASVANKISVSPVGHVELNGLHSEVLFFKDFQDQFGVKMEVIRHGKYKSAVEPFIANKMSEANKTQISELIHSVWNHVKTTIETSRNINAEEIATNLLGKLPAMALENNLVDALWYEDEYLDQIKSTIPNTSQVIAIEDYMFNNLPNALKSSIKQEKIAVIYAQGDIIHGRGDEERIGQELIIKALGKAVENETVKAIVLRINSPGGSALASDLIWNAVEKAKKEKPLIVSMGNVAASGGYYIACNAHKIFAEPTTITGSIGVFGILPNVASIAQKNGISSQVVSTHNNGAHYSAVKPMNPKFEATVKEGIEFVYSTFLSRVAQGRNMTISQIDSLAQGRVWTGIQAHKNGLIDELGSLDDAITYAAKEAQIDNYEIKEFPKYDMDLKSIIGSTLIKTGNVSPASVAQKMFSQWDQLNYIFELEGIQTRMPFNILIH